MPTCICRSPGSNHDTYIYKCTKHVCCKMSLFTSFLKQVACHFCFPLSRSFIKSICFKHKHPWQPQHPSLTQPHNCWAQHHGCLNITDFIFTDSYMKHWHDNRSHDQIALPESSSEISVLQSMSRYVWNVKDVPWRFAARALKVQCFGILSSTTVLALHTILHAMPQNAAKKCTWC